MADGVRAADAGTGRSSKVPEEAGGGTRVPDGEARSMPAVTAEQEAEESADGEVVWRLVRKLWPKARKGAAPVLDAGTGSARSAPDESGDGTRVPDGEARSMPAVTAEREGEKESADGKATRHPVQEFWAKVWKGGAAAVAIAVLATLLGNWAVHLAGPHAASSMSPSASAARPTPTPTVEPGHLPGRQDVSTMAPGKHFSARPNFEEDQSCGRPCWLPVYKSPNEDSSFVTNNWPCEYYGPNSSSSPSCITPPPGRMPDQMWNPAVADSGDRVLVLCQTTRLEDGQAAQDIHNQIGQDSNIWDMVAVPKAQISPDSPAWGQLTRVPHMAGFYEAFAPDIWLGDTGWHSIPCT
jgi:hypothetical protein